MGILISLGAISLYGCSKKEVEEKKTINKIDILDNLVIDIKDGSEIYGYLNDGRFEKTDISAKGNLRAYNDKLDIMAFLEQKEEENYLNIIFADDSMNIKIDGNLDFVYISENGEYTLYKTSDRNNIIKLNLVDNKTKKTVVLPEDILVSGELIKFIGNDTIILYGVDINNNKYGVFTYDIKSGKYTLVKEMVGMYMSSIEAISESKVFMIEVSESSSQVYILDILTKDMQLISSEFSYVEDAILYEDKVYINALENGDLNLYSIDLESTKLKRLTFDFPKSLGRESRLLAENGRVYFSDINGKVYYYDIKEDTTNLIKNQDGMYMIVDK
jgi:hypothetical protein